MALHLNWVNAKSQPSDYSPGLRFYDDNLKDKVYWGSFRVLKLVTTDRKHLKFGWEAGPAWTQTITPTNFERMTSNALFSSNYSYTSTKKNALGLSFRGKIEYSLNSYSSVELGANAQWNKLRPYYGVDLMVSLGSYQW